MRDRDRIWVQVDSIYKWHAVRFHDVAYCGTDTRALPMFRQEAKERDLEEKDCCKICWKITGKK